MSVLFNQPAPGNAFQRVMTRHEKNQHFYALRGRRNRDWCLVCGEYDHQYEACLHQQQCYHCDELMLFTTHPEEFQCPKCLRYYVFDNDDLELREVAYGTLVEDRRVNR